MKKNLLIVLSCLSLLIYFYLNRNNSTIQSSNETKQEENVSNFSNKVITPTKIIIKDDIIKKDINITPKAKDIKQKKLIGFTIDSNNTDLDDLPTEKELDMEEINMAINMGIDSEVDEDPLGDISENETIIKDLYPQ